MENGRLGMTADSGFLGGKVREQGGMGETQRLEGRVELGWGSDSGAESDSGSDSV